MPVLVGAIGPIKVNAVIWSSRVSRADALDFPARIDPSRPEFGCRWISYFDPAADMSDLDAKCLLELRERLRPVVTALAAKGEFRVMLVSNSRYNDPLLAAWRAMVATEPDYPSRPDVVRDLHSASRALGLSAVEAEEVRVWIVSRIGELSHLTR
jgi:hypothetical protein